MPKVLTPEGTESRPTSFSFPLRGTEWLTYLEREGFRSIFVGEPNLVVPADLFLGSVNDWDVVRSAGLYDYLRGVDPWQEGEASVVWAPLRFLKPLYALKGAYEIGQFLGHHPFLVPLLLEARYHIARHFPNEEVALEVVTDPEEPDFEELFAYIQTDLSPEEALSRLRRLDSEWWLEAMPRADCKLCIHLELR